MKKLFFFILLFTCSHQLLFAQYTIDKDTLPVNYSAGLDEFNGYAHITNAAGSDLSVTWTFTNLLAVPSAWVLGFCDNEGCVNITSSFKTNTFNLYKDSVVELSAHVAPHGSPANLILPIRFTDGTNITNFYLKTNMVSVGVEELNNSPLNQLTIYPNPVVSTLNCSFSLTKSADIEIQIVNNLGIIVSSKKLTDVSDGLNLIALSTDNISAGLYTLRVIAPQQVFYKPFFKL